MTDEFIRATVHLSDFNELINDSDPDTPIEVLQEISFYAFLALINLTQENWDAQLMA